MQVASDKEIRLNENTVDAMEALSALNIVPEEMQVQLFSEIFRQLCHQFTKISGLKLPDTELMLKGIERVSEEAHTPARLGRV